MEENKLAQLFVANDDFDELERALDVFCPFEAVGMINQEIRHGHFLSYIFDPQRPHGFGQDCLKALMAAAIRSQNYLQSDLSLLDVHLMDFQNAVVRREWNKIDILIEVPEHELIIAIELKIGAKEHSGQLGRYRKAVQKEWPKHKQLLLFLTKSGDDPSEDDGEGWNSVDLEALAKELVIIAGKNVGDARAKDMLGAYILMLGRNHLRDERLEEIATSLWSKHKEALEFLADRRPNAVGDLFKILIDGREELAQNISDQCGEVVKVDHQRNASIYFAVPSWDSIPGFCSAESFTPTNRLLLFEVTKAGSDYFRCYFILGKGPQLNREKLFLTLKDAGADTGKKSQLTAEWNRLASQRISLKGIDEGADLDAMSGRVFSQIRDFAEKHIPTYTKALSKLTQP